MDSLRHIATLWVLPFASILVLAACSSTSSKAVMDGEAGSGGDAGDSTGGSAGRHAGGGDAGDDANGEAGLGGSGKDEGGSAGEAGGSDLPIVVTAVSASPASLDLAAGVLYFAVNDGVSGEGKVQSVSVSGGALTTLASDLPKPRNVVANGGNVYWADSETVFPDYADVMSVPVAGGTPYEVARCDTNARLVIEGTTLYCLTNDLTTLSSFPLTGSAAVGAPVASTTHGAIQAYDSDGVSAFWFAAGTTGFDLFQIPLAGGSAADLAMDVTSGSTAFDYIAHDTASIFWSDSGTGGVYSLQKAGGTPKLLATYATGSGPVQLSLDGNDIYALSADTLSKLPKTGGAPVVLASVSGTGSDRYITDTVNASALVVDDRFVYWTYQGHNQILKIGK
jgi:hypothetical protein